MAQFICFIAYGLQARRFVCDSQERSICRNSMRSLHARVSALSPGNPAIVWTLSAIVWILPAGGLFTCQYFDAVQVVTPARQARGISIDGSAAEHPSEPTLGVKRFSCTTQEVVGEEVVVDVPVAEDPV